MLRTGRLFCNLPYIPKPLRDEFWAGRLYKNVYEVVNLTGQDSIILKPHFITPLKSFTGYNEDMPVNFCTSSIFKRTVKGESKVRFNQTTDLLPFFPEAPGTLRLPENYMWLPTYVSKGDWIFYWHPRTYFTFDFHGVLTPVRVPSYIA